MIMLIAITIVLFLPGITQAQVIFEVKSGDTLDKISKQYKLAATK
jgi:spore germination protein